MQPQDILPDHQNDVQVNGLIVRKGSVGAFSPASVTGRLPAMTPRATEADLRGLLPGLHALGLFQVLAARDPALQRLIDSSLKRTAEMPGRVVIFGAETT